MTSPAAAAKTECSPLGWLALVALGLVVMAAAAISIPARLATRVAVSDTLRYR
jgi:hypothetical protein